MDAVRWELPAGILVTGLALAATISENVPPDDPSEVEPAFLGIVGGVTVAFAVLIFAAVIPRARRRSTGRRAAAQMALVSSVVGFLSLASSWTGLPFVLGAGGAMLGGVVREERWPAWAAVVIGVATFIVACVALGGPR